MILMSMLRAAILAASVQASPVCCDCCSGIDCCAGGSCCDAACCDVAACCKACSGDGCDQCCDQAADCCNAADTCDAATKAAAKEAVASCCAK